MGGVNFSGGLKVVGSTYQGQVSPPGFPDRWSDVGKCQPNTDKGRELAAYAAWSKSKDGGRWRVVKRVDFHLLEGTGTTRRYRDSEYALKRAKSGRQKGPRT